MENNFRQAPKLYIEGSKSNKDFYKLPMNVMDVVFKALDGKNGNAIKIMVVLLGTKGDGSFRVTEKFIEQHTGITKSNYHRALDKLIELGFVERYEKSLVIKLDNILKNHDEYPKSTRDEKKSTRDEYPESTRDDDYNREKQRNNREGTDSNALFAEGSLGDDPTEWPDEYYGL